MNEGLFEKLLAGMPRATVDALAEEIVYESSAQPGSSCRCRQSGPVIVASYLHDSSLFLLISGIDQD